MLIVSKYAAPYNAWVPQMLSNFESLKPLHRSMVIHYGAFSTTIHSDPLNLSNCFVEAPDNYHRLSGIFDHSATDSLFDALGRFDDFHTVSHIYHIDLDNNFVRVNNTYTEDLDEFVLDAINLTLPVTDVRLEGTLPEYTVQFPLQHENRITHYYTTPTTSFSSPDKLITAAMSASYIIKHHMTNRNHLSSVCPASSQRLIRSLLSLADPERVLLDVRADGFIDPDFSTGIPASSPSTSGLPDSVFLLENGIACLWVTAVTEDNVSHIVDHLLARGAADPVSHFSTFQLFLVISSVHLVVGEIDNTDSTVHRSEILPLLPTTDKLCFCTYPDSSCLHLEDAVSSGLSHSTIVNDFPGMAALVNFLDAGSCRHRAAYTTSACPTTRLPLEIVDMMIANMDRRTRRSFELATPGFYKRGAVPVNHVSGDIEAPAHLLYATRIDANMTVPAALISHRNSTISGTTQFSLIECMPMVKFGLSGERSWWPKFLSASVVMICHRQGPGNDYNVYFSSSLKHACAAVNLVVRRMEEEEAARLLAEAAAAAADEEEEEEEGYNQDGDDDDDDDEDDEDDEDEEDEDTQETGTTDEAGQFSTPSNVDSEMDDVAEEPDEPVEPAAAPTGTKRSRDDEDDEDEDDEDSEMEQAPAKRLRTDEN
ncbi:hypothetical protein F503_04672 [Ophiostoma piceae UAMH 11346]|uniref:Uncharacterized protein n=1 Tax=Ophiostoma piceae (strain UAMH 11346) TaxID=1262450 RepID=S3BUK0_OPHP1|nr:hypothetical protein F503_04672 [Ophiostoma piceae UAMH 11346]